jgi:hypothetical protein
MDSNRCSREHSDQPPDNPPDDLDVLEAAVDGLARDLTGLPEPVRAQRVLRLRRLVDRQEGHWLNELAAVDACGGGRRRPGRPGALDRQLAAQPAAAGGQRGGPRPAESAPSCWSPWTWTACWATNPPSG